VLLQVNSISSKNNLLLKVNISTLVVKRIYMTLRRDFLVIQRMCKVSKASPLLQPTKTLNLSILTSLINSITLRKQGSLLVPKTKTSRKN